MNKNYQFMEIFLSILRQKIMQYSHGRKKRETFALRLFMEIIELISKELKIKKADSDPLHGR